MKTPLWPQAERIAQEAFVHHITRPEQYDPARGSIAAWLCGVARNLARRETQGREDATDPDDFEGSEQTRESSLFARRKLEI